MKKEHTLLIGPPGSGKTKWARERAMTPLPVANTDSAYAYRVAGLIPQGAGLTPQGPTWTQGFRAPHHTASVIALTGRLNGHRWQPGELSLAHGGILFLDELPEFSARCLDALREPLDTGWIDLDHGTDRLVVPADFTLIGAANPCPCGAAKKSACGCSASQIERYLARIPEWLREICTELRPPFTQKGDPT